MPSGPEHLLNACFGRKQRTDDAEAHARRVRLQMRGQPVADDLNNRLQFDRGGLIRAEAEQDTEPSPRLPFPADRRGSGIVLILAERGMKTQKPSRQDDGVLQRAVVLLARHLLTLLDDEPRRLRVGDSLDEKPPETLTRRIETWTVVQPADHGQHLADGNVHEVSSGTVREPLRLTRPMIPTARA